MESKYKADADIVQKKITQKKMDKILDGIQNYKAKNIYIATQGVDVVNEELNIIPAGGGLVENQHGELLVIHRNGLWDLPKGKKEKKEQISTTALREVEEETGVKGLILGPQLDLTYHWYYRKKWNLKQTFWYAMTAKKQKTKAETEEGIDEVRWVSREEMPSLMDEMYPNIRSLIIDHYLD